MKHEKENFSLRSALTSTIAVIFLIWLGVACSIAFTSNTQNSSRGSAEILQTNDAALRESPCADALRQLTVCLEANNRALAIMRASNLEAITVMQDVQTGALVAFAASEPAKLDVNTHVLPLSLSKLLLAASWWDNQQPDSSFDSTKGSATAQNPAFRSKVSVHEVLVGGSDSAGRQMALQLRKSVGTEAVLGDFERYGFVLRQDSEPDEKFWSEVPAMWKSRLVSTSAHIELSHQTADTEWADALSIGETKMSVTVLYMSRFLQAVGNQGVMLTPVAREKAVDKKTPPPHRNPKRVMKETAAQRLQAAMRDTVQRGTATSIATALEKTGWQIGGKTGSAKSDGWFAGLVFDPKGNARFTVATFVRHGGRGGGAAAKLSADLARFIMDGR